VIPGCNRTVTPEEGAAALKRHFHQVREIIQAEEMWERVPESARQCSPENLEGLVKFAYFGGFIDMAAVRRLLRTDKAAMRRLLAKWYEEVREQGCWLC
jgi:hypothetical protein